MNLEEQMYSEDEYLKALIDRDNKISYFLEQLDNTKEQLVDEQKLTRKKDKIVKKLQLELAKTLKDADVPVQIIMEKTKLSKEEIEKL
jgi:hypothetical protein